MALDGKSAKQERPQRGDAFTSAPVARALVEAKRRGVEVVAVLL